MLAMIATTAAAIGAVIGVAELSRVGLLLVSAEIAAIAACVTIALSARTATMKAWWWRTSLLVALLLPLGISAYHQWLDPATRVPETYQLVANGGNANFIPLFGEAGGVPQTIETGPLQQNALIGGQTYEFDCWVIGRDGAQWLKYRRFGHIWYAPQAKLHPPAGLPDPKVPHC
jgi:hypothetical protein